MNEDSFSFGVESDRIDRLLSLGMERPEADEAIDQTNPLDPLTEGPGQWIGRYKLLSVLGEGGMGTVYLGEQRQPIRRRVALKIIKIGMDTKQVIARFEAERQALALMDHPHIAGVLDAGTTESGRPYFVMEMVKGIPITTYSDKEQLDTKARLELFVKVCQALQHAHQKGIIHRDIKPSNILVMPQDGIPVPKVIDFGIAKATQQELSAKAIYTQVSQFMGTPAYMSPEQAEMSRLDIDTRSDIYGLGVLLYELLTGTTPFDTEASQGAGFDEMRKIIQHQEPVKPSTRLRQTSDSSSSSKFPLATSHSSIATDLDWIVMKCLEKDRTRRYETANALAMDLRRHLSDETIMARPPSRMYKLRKAFRRNRVLCAAATMVVVAALLAGIAVSTWQAARARGAEREQSRLREEAQDLQQSETALRILAEETSTQLREHLYVSEMYAAYQAFRAGSIQRARDLLARQTEDATEALRGFEWRWLWAQTRARETFVMSLGEFRFVTAVDFSADGSRYLTLDDGHLQVWDTATHELVGSHAHPFGYRAEYSRDGKLIISTETTTRAVRLSDGGTGLERIRLVGHTQPVLAATISPDGTLVASAGATPYSRLDGEIFLWDVASQERLAVLSFSGSEFIADLAFSPDGRTLAAACGNGDVLLWDVTSRKLFGRLTGHRRAVMALSFALDAQRLITLGLDRTVRLWDTRTQKEISLLGLLEKGGGFNVAVSPDGRWAATSGFDHMVKIWDLDSPGEYSSLRGHVGRVVGVAFHPDGKTLTTTGLDGAVRFWDLPQQSDDWTLDAVYGVCFGFSEKTPLLLGIEVEGHVDVWNVPTQERVLHVEGKNATWLPGGEGIVFQREQALIEWDLAHQDEHLLSMPSENPDGIKGLACSPDGRIIAWGEGDQIHVWHRTQGQEIAKLSAGENRVDRIAFSPDGATMAACGRDSSVVQLWDAVRWQTVRELRGHRLGIFAIAFSPDGQTLASAGADQTTRLWDLASGTATILQSDEGALHTLAFSPDGRTLAVGTFEGSIKLWSIATQQQVATFAAGASIVQSVTFAPDGSALASSTMDGRVRVWRAPTWDDIHVGPASDREPFTRTSQ